jgi:hypothetical protein
MSNKLLKEAPHNHDSHGLGPVRTGHAHSDMARDGAPKFVHSVRVHGGMNKVSQSGIVGLGGNHASAIDAVTGATVVPGAVKSTPGYGNSGVHSGHPFAKAPGTKRLAPVRPAFGMKCADNLEELGRAVLAQAIKN